jgi:4-hydroxybenzoate polyprenyltransferase
VQNILSGYLRLLRPANIVTAIADIAAGVTIANASFFETTAAHWSRYALLFLSTACLYGGGVVLNDAFDADLDRVERPERPIPSGLIPERNAFLFGFLLLLAGVAAAFLLQPASGAIALVIAVAVVVYDKWAKHHPFFGPLNMGLCRGLNLWLGISIDPWFIGWAWIFAIVPVVYIAAITSVSRGEVHGGGRRNLYLAAALYGLVILALAFLALDSDGYVAIPFLLLFGFLIYRPLLVALRQPVGPNIGKAVKAGVLALIVLDASWAAAFGDLRMALLILLLLPVSVGLAKAFAVT